MRLKDSLIQDPKISMDSLVGLFLAMMLAAIVLLPSLVSRALVKLISLLLSSRTFWTLTLMGIVSILTPKQRLNKGLLKSRGVDTSRLVVVNVVTIEEFRSKALRAIDIYLKTR